MTLDIHNWSSSVHQEIHKIVKDEIFPIVNQVDAIVQNFKIKFLKEATKFVRDFKFLANEADESLAKHKALELEIERLLRAIVSQYIMSIMLNPPVVETSYLQTELEQCKYDKISYDKAYKDMQQKIKWLRAQLGDQKGKCEDTLCLSDTLDSLSQKLENKNLRDQLFDKVSEQKDMTKERPKLVPPKVGESNDLSIPFILNSVPTRESKVVKNDKVIILRMFRIDPRKTFREDKFVPINKVRASCRISPITVSQPHVITKKDVKSNSNGLSSTGLDITTETRRPQHRSNTKNDRVPSASKSSCIKNKEVEVKEHQRNSLLSKNKQHMSSKCNNVKLSIQNDKSKVVCTMCKQCLIIANHDVCVLNYVNVMNSRGKKQKENVSNSANQTKHKPQVKKPKKVGSKERLASPKPSKPRMYLRWSPTGRIFDLCGKIIKSSDSECKSDTSKCDDANASNPQESTIKRFPNSTSFLGRNLKLLINFFWKFLGTVRFENDHVAAILGYGDLQWRNILITKVAFRRNTCFVRNLEGVDLLKGNRTTNLYTINLHEMASASPICLMARATTKSKDEAPKVIKTFLKRITILLQSPVIIIRTDNGTQFKNQILKEYFDSVGISHQASFVRTTQQNGVVERRKWTLVEAARTMLIFFHAPLFLWAENDREDIGKLGAKGDINFFIGYSDDSCAYRVYNRRIKKIMEIMNVTFDELSAMDFK
ncbi:integrase, catalytic region, zinc finger, CCHC-type containing protein [Tanacetum coccineum]